VQVGRQRKEILQLQRAGISTAAAELLVQRMLTKIDGLCAERDRLKDPWSETSRRKASKISASRIEQSKKLLSELGSLR
jgi:hypothetical protein